VCGTPGLTWVPQVNLKGDAAQLLEPGAAKANGHAAPAAPAAAPAGASSPQAAASPAGAAGDSWDEEQELALIKALKVIGKDVEDRWRHVAELVPGKSKAECFRRFKALKDAHKAKRSG
jgi:DnaJ family protein C protein 2